MARKQTRRSVSMSREIYTRLTELGASLGIPVAQLVEQAGRAILDGTIAVTLGRAPTTSRRTLYDHPLRPPRAIRPAAPVSGSCAAPAPARAGFVGASATDERVRFRGGKSGAPLGPRQRDQHAIPGVAADAKRWRGWCANGHDGYVTLTVLDEGAAPFPICDRCNSESPRAGGYAYNGGESVERGVGAGNRRAP